MHIIQANDTNAIENLSAILKQYITDDTIFFCIGSDKIIFDSLGPIIGTLLQYNNISVYGTLSDPITASNLMEKYKLIQSKLPQSKNILAIDVTMSNLENEIIFENKPSYPAYNRFGPIGNMSLMGSVGGNHKFNDISLMNIFNMALIITKSILSCYNKEMNI